MTKKPVDENAKRRKKLIEKVNPRGADLFLLLEAGGIEVHDALEAEVNAAIAADDPAKWREVIDRLDTQASRLLRAAQELLALRKKCEELSFPTDGY